MNYFEFHLGDYSAATSHLSWDEDMAYERLIRAYYHHEKPIPLEISAACRLARATTPAQRKAVEIVLNEFFVQAADGWHQKRCDKEIARYMDKQSKAKRSANARWQPAAAAKVADATAPKDALPTDDERNANEMRTHSEGNAPSNQTPITNNQEPNNPPPASPSVPPSDAGSEKPPRPSKRCPDEFAPSQQLIDAMLLEAPDIDVERELAKFRDHTFRVGRTDWAATFRNWLRESVDRSKPSGGSFLDAKKAEGAKWFKDTSFDLSSTANRDSFDAQLAIR